STIEKVCDKVEEQFLKPLGKPRLKVRRLAIFTHGSFQDGAGLLMARSASGRACNGPDCANLHHGTYPSHIPSETWIGKGSIAKWVEKLGPNLHDEVVIALMACLAGQGNDAFGEPAQGSYVGETSYAAVLCKALHEQGGLSNPAVWAHTTA